MAIYVCSDIHGSYDLLQTMLKKIQFSKTDKLYIIGDIIDKGLQPMEILEFCMENDNVTLLMGNHELMMYKAYTIDNESDLWFLNGGLYTCRQFESLSMQKQDAIFDYIENLPVIIKDVEVNGKTFYLSHATYFPYNLQDNKKEFTISDIGLQKADNLLWQRNYPFENITNSCAYREHKKSILISGHTVGIKLYEKDLKLQYAGKAFIYRHNGHYINLDCGLAYRHALFKSFIPRLGVLRLDDMKEFYVELKNI